MGAYNVRGFSSVARLFGLFASLADLAPPPLPPAGTPPLLVAPPPPPPPPSENPAYAQGCPPLDIVRVTSSALRKIEKHPHSWTFT